MSLFHKNQWKNTGVRANVRSHRGHRPPPELIIALKFLAATSPWRRLADRGQDTVDLMNIVDTVGSRLDRARALAHAATVYLGADKELANVFHRIDHGEKVQI